MAESLRLRVPEGARRVLSLVAALPPERQDAVLAVFHAATLPESAEDLEAQLRGLLEEADARDLVRQVFSLSGLRASGSYELEEVASAAAHADNLELGTQERDRLSNFFRSALDSPVARVLGKGSFLFQEQDKVFTGARIVSDLRPVLDEHGSDPTAAMILHRLRLTYFADGGDKDIEIGLTPDALDALAQIIDRAREKESSYGELLGRAKLTLIDPTL